MADDALYSSLNDVQQEILNGLEYKPRIEALVDHAADKVYGGLHVLHESWTKDQLAMIYHYSPQFVEGTFVEAITTHHLRVDVRDYLQQIRALSRNGYAAKAAAGAIFHGQTLEILKKTYYAEPQWAVHGLVPEGCIILAGKPKQGKSYLALVIALAVAKQQTCMDHYTVTPGDVLCFSLEDYAKRVQKRIELLNTPSDSDYTIEFFYEAPKMSEGFGQRLRATLAQRPSVRLVIIDTLRCIRDGQTEQYNLYQEDSDFIGGLNQCAQDAGATILIIHHTRKAKSDDVFDEISGTGGLRGATSGNMVLEETKGEADGMLRVEGKDFVQRLNVALKRQDNGSWTYVGQGEVYQLRSNKRAVVDAIVALGDDANAKDIWITSKIDSYGSVKTMLSRMVGLGELGKTNKGIYFVLHEEALTARGE